MPITLEDVTSRVATGQSFVQIAHDLGISRSNLYVMLDKWADQDSSARDKIDAAKQISAEAWLDKGLTVIESALRRDSGVDSNAARAYAQECARRAAIRNPLYRDKVSVEHTRKAGDYSTMSDDELIALAHRQQPAIEG
jgi:Mg-chelatase subunit ChlI